MLSVPLKLLKILLFAEVLLARANQLDDITECKVLFVADLSERAPPSQNPTIVGSMNALFTGADANRLNISIAFWRYSRGDEESDGPLPTTFAYDLQSVVINFGLQGGNLDIEYATKKLSSWQVEDAIIVLFTGSDPSKFAPAGRDYTRKVWTVGVAAGVDTSPFAARSIIYMQPLAIFDAVVDLCQSGTTTTSFPETTATAEISTSTSTSPPERTKCVALFYIDASTATIALNATSPEKAFILSIGEALYPDGSIELIAALAAYGDDDFDQKPDVDTTDVDLVNLTADLDQYRFEAPNDDNVKNAIRYLNQIEAKLNNIVVVLMTASNQDIIDSASGSNQHASWTIGLALSGQNLTGIAVESADLTMKDQTASLLKTMCLNAATPISALGMGST